MEIRKVRCEAGELSYTLIRKSVKNVNLRIKADGSIVVSANRRVAKSFIDDFVKEKQKFIFAALEQYERNRKDTIEKPKQYRSGEFYNILGKSLELKVEKAWQEEVLPGEKFLYLRVRNPEDLSHKKILMEQWMKQYQRQIFEEICRKVYQKFEKYHVVFPEIKIRYMTSRWGSCRPHKNSITLNSRLIEVQRACIEYVVLHEFAHFIYPNHSKEFWDFVSRLMPDWKERRKKLSDI